MEQKIQNLEAAIGALAKNNPGFQTCKHTEQISEGVLSTANKVVTEEHQQDPPDATHEQTSQWKIVIDLESSPGALPGNYLFRTGSTQPKSAEDFISRGIIDIENARIYFDEYQNRLDHFVYRILGDHSTATLEYIRKASPLLTAASCAVGALHLASRDFDPCYKEFFALSTVQSFSKRNTVNDVRALCIGAFWLSDLSWQLVGIAVRVATELQLHKSFTKALQGDREHYLRTRLYLLVYACDHHFSVVYGRPPMTRECEIVKNARKFLDCVHATEDDARLVSQVLRWSTCSNIYNSFGADVDRPLSDSEIPQIRRFSIALESLRAEWADRFGSNIHVGNYPCKGVGLQYHFAKLYLCSHALRGVKSAQARIRSPSVAWELDEIANSAVLSAVSILRAVTSDTEIQSFLNGLPTYFDIMIAFAVVFLLKVSTHFSASVQLDVKEFRRLTSTLLVVLKEVTATMHSHHLLVSITRGIDSLLQRYEEGVYPPPALPMVSLPHELQQDLHDSHTLNGDLNLPNEVFDQFFMTEYDFLPS